MKLFDARKVAAPLWGVARRCGPAPMRLLYLIALEIENLAFWAGWQARKNYRWKNVCRVLVKIEQALKEIYFAV